MDIVKIISISLCCLIILILLRKLNNDYAILASCVINVFISIFSLSVLMPVFDYINSFSDSRNFSNFYTIMFKAAGISLLCTFASEICKDAGESLLSSRIEFAGKCTLLTMSLPLIKKVFEYATSFV